MSSRREQAGMCVALRQSAMLLSELAIIYLAAAAPFGVGHFLRRHARDARHSHSIAKAAAAPTPRELELCRIAGRAGDDLLAAGRCVHRRNVTRLLAHRERSRSELVHALADVRDLARNTYPPPRPFHAADYSVGDNANQIP